MLRAAVVVMGRNLSPAALADSVAVAMLQHFQVLVAMLGERRSPHPFLDEHFQKEGSCMSKNC